MKLRKPRPILISSFKRCPNCSRFPLFWENYGVWVRVFGAFFPRSLANKPRFYTRRKQGRRKKEEGRRKKEEGRRKKEEGRRKKEEGRPIKLMVWAINNVNHRRDCDIVVLPQLIPPKLNKKCLSRDYSISF